MKRLKELREASNYTQRQLASMLKTTQQTIGRWESGKAEPSLSSLRDLALIFGTSVDDLLGKNPLSDRPQSTHYHIAMGGTQDGFWGHAGLKFDDGPSKWFPITLGEAERIGNQLSRAECDEWIGFATLANKFVACRPATLKKFWLLDDACDGPEGDWVIDLPYQGLPSEIYRTFDRLQETALTPSEWKKAAGSLSKLNGEGEAVDDDIVAWEKFVQRLSKEFKGDASDEFLATAAANFIEEKLYEDDRFFRYQNYSTIYFTNGEPESFWIEPRDLDGFSTEIDMAAVSSMIKFEEFGGGAERYYSSSRISAVIMPLQDLADAMKAENEEAERNRG